MSDTISKAAVLNARVAGMVADNAMCAVRGDHPQWTRDDFEREIAHSGLEAAPLPAEQPSNPVGYFNAEHGVFWTFSELSADSALIRKGIAVPVFTAARIVGQQTNSEGK